MLGCFRQLWFFFMIYIVFLNEVISCEVFFSLFLESSRKVASLLFGYYVW